MSPSTPATPLSVNRWWPWSMTSPGAICGRVFPGVTPICQLEDIIICEVIPGEIYLCNTLIKNRKRGSSLIILHSYDQLPEDEFMINCLKGVIFVSLKTASIPQLLAIIKKRASSIV